MLPSGSQSKFGRFVQKIEFRLILVFGYVGALIYTVIKTGSIWPVILMHAIFAIIISMIYYWRELLMFLLAPILLIIWPIENFLVKRYLRKQNFKQNVPAWTVVVLGHSNWFMLEGWVKLIFVKSDIKQLVKTMRTEGRDFSFYPNAKLVDVEKIMSDKSIEEVYFIGHGNSHCFQLGTNEILYYCEFNDPKYNKRFVHQIHCGDPYGKSLVDYVVTEENKAKCFLFRKPITSFRIQKELKRREKLALLKQTK